MDILEFFYSNPPSIENYHPRKLNYPKNSFFLKGARGVGKSYFILNYLKEFNKKNFLYIDCKDPIFILEKLTFDKLENFIKKEKIELLILDHYSNNFLEKLPQIKVIIISRDDIEFNLEKIELFPLDFEEFLNFIKNSNITTAFTLYTKRGSLPSIARNSNIQLEAKEFFFEKFESQEKKIILMLSLFSNRIITINQIYKRAKDYFKISKDWLYKTIKKFENEKIIYLINRKDKGFGQKIILYDFVFTKYLNKHLPFLYTFDLIIANSLIKKKKSLKALINPLGYIIDEKKITLIMPFDNEESAWVKIQNNFNLFNKYKRIEIITISNSFNFKIKNSYFYAIPFYEWTLIED